ncbi:protein kinase-like protein [Lotmaria passim]
MPVSSLLERMRKKLQEKAAATGGGAVKSSTNDTANPNSSNAEEESGGPPSSSPASGNGGHHHHHSNSTHASSTSTSQRAESAVPLPPPVFASPSSARLDYRDPVNDPLCVPFTADMAVTVLEELLRAPLDNPQERERQARLSAEGKNKVGLLSAASVNATTLTSSSVAPQLTCLHPSRAAMAQGSSAVVENTVRHLRTFLAAAQQSHVAETLRTPDHSSAVVDVSTHGEIQHSESPPASTPATLYADAAYFTACALSHVDVSGDVRPVCRDVNYYSRVGRISQGVYGVVFHAVAANDDDGNSDEPNDLRTNNEDREKNEVTTSPTVPSSPPLLAPPRRRKSYALKHIKKMWLEESQIGFPPYLLREIDLLLRLKHPNVMGARELVLLDPVPLPKPALQATTTSASHVDSSPFPPPASAPSRRRPREDDCATEQEGFDTSSPQHPPPQQQQQAQQQPKTHEASTTATSDHSSRDGVVAARPLAAVGALNETKDVFLVMDYCPFDLTTYMRRYHTTTTHQIPFFHMTARNAHADAAANYIARAKSIAYQLFSAAAFMHANRVLHRDLKTSNVLLDDNGYVKVCDFGLGRLYREGQGLTPTVVTLMYRAPELHLGVVDYSHKMDVWSLGCILAELFLRRPLFHASTDSHHLLAVCDTLGIPTEETFPGLYHLPQTKLMMQSLPRWNRVSKLAELFQPGATVFTPSHGEAPVAAEATLLPAEGLELLQSILQWNPRRRPSAEEVLRHPFFHTAPLPCAPAELMRPMPWADAEPPTVAAAAAAAAAAAVTGRYPLPPTAVEVSGAKTVASGHETKKETSHGAVTTLTELAVLAAQRKVAAAAATPPSASRIGKGASAADSLAGLNVSASVPKEIGNVTHEGSVAAEPSASARSFASNSKADFVEDMDSPGRGPGQLQRQTQDAEEAEHEVRLAQMKANQDTDDDDDDRENTQQAGRAP